MTKQELRDYLASLPIDQKVDILEQLRQRDIELAEAREQLRKKLSPDATSDPR